MSTSKPMVISPPTAPPIPSATTAGASALPTINSPKIFYVFLAFIVFFIIMIWVVFYDITIPSSTFQTSKSEEELIGNIFIILFFALLVFGLCVVMLPNMAEFKTLVQQIHHVVYVVIYTIVVILFYTMMPSDTLNRYAPIFNLLMLSLGAVAFYKSASTNYVEQFSVYYERIKMLILIFCFITIIITLYNINPGGVIQQYFGYSLLITIIMAVFGLLYLMVLFTLPKETARNAPNAFSAFSKFSVWGTIGFVLFIAMITTMITMNRETFFSNRAKSSSVIIMVLIVSILWSLLLGANLFHFDKAQASTVDTTKLNYFKSGLLALFGVVMMGLFIFWLSSNLAQLSTATGTAHFVLNLLIVLSLMALVYKTIFVKLPTGNEKKNAFFSLLWSIIVYIPCLAGNLVDRVAGLFTGTGEKSAQSQELGSLLLVVITAVLVAIYYQMPTYFSLVQLFGGKLLVNQPIYTDEEHVLGSYQDLRGDASEEDTYDYQYAISCWIYLDSAPPNTNPRYNDFVSLLNFGEKPNILYNASRNTLMITMDQKQLKQTTHNKLTDFDEKGHRILYVNKEVLLQKWNHLIVNYNGGTMDIFLNGELVKSSIGVVPYYTYDSLIVGENGGVRGGMCNVVYFRQPLNAFVISQIYGNSKDLTPPADNYSNQTIMDL